MTLSSSTTPAGLGWSRASRERSSHKIIEQGLEVLINLGHRGACGADPKTGDGAGITVQMPHEFFREECSRLGIDLPHRGEYAVGMTFLPQDAQANASAARTSIREMRRGRGPHFPRLARRAGEPRTPSASLAAPRACPSIRQFFVKRPHHIPDDEHGFELQALRHAQGRSNSAVDAADLPEQGRLLHLQPLCPHDRLQGPAHRRPDRALLPRPGARVHGLRLRAGALALQHQHAGHLEACPPLPLRRPQRRDQHPARQHQLDGGARADVRLARSWATTSRSCCPSSPRLPARATPPASTTPSSCCSPPAARCRTRC